jgi:hypothetical protein
MNSINNIWHSYKVVLFSFSIDGISFLLFVGMNQSWTLALGIINYVINIGNYGS